MVPALVAGEAHGEARVWACTVVVREMAGTKGIRRKAWDDDATIITWDVSCRLVDGHLE